MNTVSRTSWLPALVILPAALLLASCQEPEAGAPEGDEGAFVVRLGTDTVGVERYRLSPERMEILAVTRSPRTLRREVTLEFGEDGGLTRYESRVVDPAAQEEGPTQRTVMTYGPDRIRVESGVGEEAEIDEVEGDPRMIPLSFDHFSLVELAIRRAFEEGLEEGTDTVPMWMGGPMPMELQRIDPDSVALVTPNLGTWRARVDDEGRILQMEAGALGRDVERVDDLDVEALALQYAELDSRGEGMGPLSPRDTVRATVSGATITVDYGRPAARGRLVFGGLVPYGEIWRTGANQATHLTTDRPLELGDETLPPGTFTVFTIPESEGWTLIMNRETGQAGTEYDPDMDLFRTTLEVRRLDEPVGRFTIRVEPEGEGGVLRFLWEDTEARIPFGVGSGDAGTAGPTRAG